MEFSLLLHPDNEFRLFRINKFIINKTNIKKKIKDLYVYYIVRQQERPLLEYSLARHI